MSFKTLGLSDELQSYVVAHSAAPDALITDLVAETRASLPDQAEMQIAPGKSWKWTASKAGVYDYVCTLHPTMKGTITVM